MDRREFLKASGLLAIGTQLPALPSTAEAGNPLVSVTSQWIRFTPALTAGVGEAVGWYQKNGALVVYRITSTGQEFYYNRETGEFPFVAVTDPEPTV